MPRQPIDYTNTHFYKICCNNLNITDIYVGHTTDFRRRKSQHKMRCCNENSKQYNLQVYRFIRDHGNWDNWSMILIETRQCADSLEATKIEREFMEQLHATLNQRIPSRTKKEYHEENRDLLNEKKKQYYEANKDEISERKKQVVICEICNVQHRLNEKPRHIRSQRHQSCLPKEDNEVV